MKNQKKYVCLVISLFLCSLSLSAQNNTRDVVYLKNGSIIKGTLVEILPAVSVKIQTADGSIFVYAIADVEKIEKETMITPQPAIPISALPVQEAKEIGIPKFSIYGGVAIPVGDFAEEMIWHTKTGFTIGMQYTSGGDIGFLLNGSYASNPTSFGDMVSSYGSSGTTSSSWESILVLTGLKIGTTSSKGVNFIFAPLFGFNVGISPKLNYSIAQPSYEPYGSSLYYYSMTMESVTSMSVAYGAMMEINLGRATMGARYIASKPKFQMSVNYPGTYAYYEAYYGSISRRYEQTISMIQLYLGLMF